MEKFTDSLHCTSRVHCLTCVSVPEWRDKIKTTMEWDGSCPLSEKEREIKYQESVLKRMIKRGCKDCEINAQKIHIDKMKL